MRRSARRFTAAYVNGIPPWLTPSAPGRIVPITPLFAAPAMHSVRCALAGKETCKTQLRVQNEVLLSRNEALRGQLLQAHAELGASHERERVLEAQRDQAVAEKKRYQLEANAAHGQRINAEIDHRREVGDLRRALDEARRVGHRPATGHAPQRRCGGGGGMAPVVSIASAGNNGAARRCFAAFGTPQDPPPTPTQCRLSEALESLQSTNHALEVHIERQSADFAAALDALRTQLAELQAAHERDRQSVAPVSIQHALDAEVAQSIRVAEDSTQQLHDAIEQACAPCAGSVMDVIAEFSESMSAVDDTATELHVLRERFKLLRDAADASPSDAVSLAEALRASARHVHDATHKERWDHEMSVLLSDVAAKLRELRALRAQNRKCRGARAARRRFRFALALSVLGCTVHALLLVLLVRAADAGQHTDAPRAHHGEGRSGLHVTWRGVARKRHVAPPLPVPRDAVPHISEIDALRVERDLACARVRASTLRIATLDADLRRAEKCVLTMCGRLDTQRAATVAALEKLQARCFRLREERDTLANCAAAVTPLMWPIVTALSRAESGDAAVETARGLRDAAAAWPLQHDDQCEVGLVMQGVLAALPNDETQLRLAVSAWQAVKPVLRAAASHDTIPPTVDLPRVHAREGRVQ